MPPRNLAQRRQTQSQGEHLYAPGKVGRRTGITLEDDGRRDADGFQVVDGLFSSPDRDLERETRGLAKNDDEPEEQDMEIDDGSELGPATTRRLQQSRLSLPRARSPIKTNLKSPARQNPHMPPVSSPAKGAVVATQDESPGPEVARKLDFSKDPAALTNGHATKANSAGSRLVKQTNGRAQPSHTNQEPDVPDHSSSAATDNEEEDEPFSLLDAVDAGADSGHNGDVEEELGPEVDDDIPAVPRFTASNKPKPTGRGGRKPKAAAAAASPDPPDVPSEESAEDDEPVKKRNGRMRPPTRKPAKASSPIDEPAPPAKSSKRERQPIASVEDDAPERDEEPRGAKRQKTAKKTDKAAQSASSSKPAAAKEKSKAGRKRKSSGVGVESPIQRGPPLPKSRGLVTIRREDTTTMKTTRSGRASFKPLEWWKGEHVEYDQEEEALFEDAGNRHFKMPTVKGIVRTEESADGSSAASKRRGRPAAGRKGGKRQPAIPEEDEVEREEWEYNSGHIVGEVLAWEPMHEFEPPGDEDEVEIINEELAVAEQAIQLKDIKDATFKFAKTLTLPFFGSGVVDLPPGAEKRPKNSRKMHLAFFVHTGNVQVTIAQTEFGVSKGGMFFVPRGNLYWIRNETDRPARMFFAQGCELLVQAELGEEE
ncbi:Mif2/CENP-C like-domain-containing protein [Xylaria sp. CBS 124048]|nr:Mif2/CENP-C like-domain-containing protein [Xylaria sp. CBS 124048]